MNKKLFCLFFCLALLMFTAGISFADDFAPPVSYSPATGDRFARIAKGGFGDSANSYSWSVLSYKGDLYVGTNRHHLHSMYEALGYLLGGSPSSYLPAWLLPDAPPSTTWFTKEWAQAFQAEMWRYRKGKWERVHQAGVVQLPDGRWVPVSYGYRALYEFKGNLYALGIGTWMPPLNTNTILKTSTGNPGQWQDITGSMAQTTNVRAIAEFNNKLYVAAAVPTGAVVFASANPGVEDWQLVSIPGFGGDNAEIYYLTVFNNHLYASTVNYVDGFEVWKTNGGPDGANSGKILWTQVLKHGFGDTWNQYGMTMAVLKNHLYVGTAVGTGIVLKDQQPVGTRATEIIRIDKNDRAQLVVGASVASDPIDGGPNPRIPRSGLGAGFGNPFNVYSWNMNTYKGCLYVGTLDLGLMAIGAIEKDPEVLRMFISRYQTQDLNFPRGIVDALINGSFTQQVLDLMLTAFGGGDIWKSCDGIRWKPVTLNGFGNHYNYGIREIIPVKKNGKDTALVVGTANPFTGRTNGGCEVWVEGTLPTSSCRK